jgi:protein phosphatase
MSVPDPEHFVTSGLSDIGQVREVNQDYCGEFSDPARRRRLLIVADGMGGHRGGEVASRLAVETAAEVFRTGGEDPAQVLRAALEAANHRVYEAARADVNLAGMGTTGVCLLFEGGGRGYVAHVGDSRAYRLRGDVLEQITDDHSVVGALVRMGHITEDEAKLHPQRNEILRAIGTAEDVEVQITPLELEPGDRYLLCSDGLSGLVGAGEIAEVLAQHDPAEAVRTLVQMANLEGGNDNITVQVAVIPGEPRKRSESTTQTLTAPPRSKAADPRERSPRSEPRDSREQRPSASSAGIPGWLWAAGLALVAVLGWLLLGR